MNGHSVTATLGVDVGTTHTKVAVVTEDGRIVALGRRATPWVQRPGGAEVTAQELVETVLAAASNALAEAGGAGPRPVVRGVGVTGMAEAGVLIDRHGDPMGPVIAWFDERGADEVESLDDDFGAAFAAGTGLALTALPTFSKLLWRHRHAGHDWTGCRWLNVPEYVVHALGGDQVTEPSLASRTGLLEQDSAGPFLPSFQVLGADPSLVPELVPAGTPVGRVGDRWPGPLRGAVLTVAGHDHPVASLGAGAVGPDDLFDSCGTAEALIRVTEQSMTPQQRLSVTRVGGTQGMHVIPGWRLLLGGTRGGLLLRRTLAMLGATDPTARDALDRACPLGDPDPAVRFEAVPRESSRMRLHIDREDVTPPAVWRAALDRANADARDLAEAFAGIVGPASRVIAAGGWTRLSSFRTLKRRSFPAVTFSTVDEPGSVGAAALAFLAAQHDRSIDVARYVQSFCGFGDIT
jgi:sugar (pentulose or hexulose) kinase